MGGFGKWIRVVAAATALGLAGGAVAMLSPAEATSTFQFLRPFNGPNRYDTARLVAVNTFFQANHVILASGTNYPDALAASYYAGDIVAPILLTGARHAAGRDGPRAADPEDGERHDRGRHVRGQLRRREPAALRRLLRRPHRRAPAGTRPPSRSRSVRSRTTSARSSVSARPSSPAAPASPTPWPPVRSPTPTASRSCSRPAARSASRPARAWPSSASSGCCSWAAPVPSPPTSKPRSRTCR